MTTIGWVYPQCQEWQGVHTRHSSSSSRLQPVGAAAALYSCTAADMLPVCLQPPCSKMPQANTAAASLLPALPLGPSLTAPPSLLMLPCF